MASSYRTDSAGFFQTRFLDQKLPKVLQKRYPELYFASGRFLPEFTDLNPGTQNIITEVVQEYGSASIMSGMAQDIPLNMTTVSEESQPVIAVVSGAQYNVREVDAAALAAANGQLATNLTESRLLRMRRSIEEKCHQLGAFGASKYGIYGLLNNPSVTVSNTSTIKPYAPVNITPTDTIIDWFASFFTSMANETNLVESPNVMLVPHQLHRKLATTFRTTTSDMTLMQAVMDTNPSLVAIHSIRELRNADLQEAGVLADGTKERIVLYTLNSENLYRRVAPIVTTPVERHRLNYEVMTYKCLSGVVVDYPSSMRYIDYLVATS